MLRNKHQLASFSEVFLNPHYWRLFDMLTSPPNVVIDLGGNCGLFPVLCEIVSRSKFGDCTARYYIFEAVKTMTKNIACTARQAKIKHRLTIVHGAVGKCNGQASFASGPKSFLDSSAVFSGKNRRFRERVGYVDLANYFHEQGIANVDILKVDIEGSEYDLIETFPQLFKIARVVFVELHQVREDCNQLSEARLFFKESGLSIIEPVLRNGPHELLLLRRG
jgi:FkbM family methyltransferase